MTQKGSSGGPDRLESNGGDKLAIVQASGATATNLSVCLPARLPGIDYRRETQLGGAVKAIRGETMRKGGKNACRWTRTDASDHVVTGFRHNFEATWAQMD